MCADSCKEESCEITIEDKEPYDDPNMIAPVMCPWNGKSKEFNWEYI